MTLPFFSVFKIIMEGKAASRFLLGAVASLSFSIAVILCTIGLMDGFENTLKSGLSKSSGDISIYKDDTFFYFSKDLKTTLDSDQELFYSPVLQSEGFLLGRSDAKGVLVKGVQGNSFSDVTKLNINVSSGQIILGKELFEQLDLKVGDNVMVAFGTSSQRNQGAPVLKEFSVIGFATHGIYEKDLRFIYINELDLRSVLRLKDNVFNSINVKLKKTGNTLIIEDKVKALQQDLNEYRVVPFWKEFQTLIDAVEVEKLSISLVLQLIVVVAIFNVIAFIIFISEKKSQEFFLLRALGLNLKAIIKFWIITVMGIWFSSCIISIGMAKLFNYLLMHLSLFKLPGEIYVLSNLKLDLELQDYLIVFGTSLLWILLITFIGLLRLRKKTLIYGLRQEFA